MAVHEWQSLSPTKKGTVLTSVVLRILVVALFTMAMVACSSTPLLLYMKRLNYAQGQHATFYVNTVAIGQILSVVVAIPLGHLAATFNAGYTLALGYATCAVGMLFVIFSQSNRYMFMFGYAIFYICSTFRVLRFTIIGNSVPKEHRTMVMGLHQLMVPCGALLGPSIWLLVQTWRGQRHPFPSIIVDRYTVNYCVTMLIAVGLGVLSYMGLQDKGREAINDPQKFEIRECDCESVCSKCHPLRADYGSTQAVDLSGAITLNEVMVPSRSETEIYRKVRLLFFGALILLFRIALVIVLVLFQPVLVIRYGAGDEEVGKAYMIVSFISLLPPIIIVFLSRMMDDRYILLLGLALKLFGTALCLPPFTFLGKWQIIIAFCLVVKGSSFTTTSAISLYTKILGPISTERTLGYLWSFGNAIPALVQVGFASQLVSTYATWGFLWVVVPIAVALGMTMCPSGWKLLNADSEITLRMTAQRVVPGGNTGR